VIPTVNTLTGYVAPDNAGIAAIKAKTDNLPTDPADQSLLVAAISGIPAAPSAATVATAVRSELTTELGRIDTPISSRNATAPDNAGIAAIKAKTDNLPSDPADQSLLTASIAAIGSAPSAATVATAVRAELATELSRVDVAVGSRLATASYVAPANADIAAVKAKTDNLPSDPADQSLLTASIAAIPAAPSASSVATAVRSELGAELGRVDVAISTRLSSASYVAPANADITAIKAKTDVMPTSAQIADKILTRNLAGGVDGGRTVVDALRAQRNRVAIVGSTLTVYAEDDTTVAWTAQITTEVRDALQSVDPA
jgi:hypothetical protein